MKKTVASIAGVLTLTLGLAACSDGGSNDQAADGTIKIVASTSVWGDIAKTVAGEADNVEVVNILSSTNDDPHEYEATARDLATISDADIVVGNGGGYDNWLTDHVEEGTPLVTAEPLAEAHHHDHDHGDHDHGHDHEGEDAHADHEGEDAHANHDHEGHDHGDEATTAGDDHGGHNHGAAFENDTHSWMSMDKVDDFAEKLAEELHKLDSSIPEDANKTVDEKTHAISERVAKLKKADYILTEPVGYHLIADSNLHDVTPAGFAQAIASEAEPAAADIAAAQKIINDGGAQILITNEQSQTPASQELIRAAKDKNVAVINVNETPDSGDTYFDYVDKFLSELETATK